MTNVALMPFTAPGASESRALGARSAGEVMSAEEFGVKAAGDPAATTAGFLRLLDFVVANGARVFTLPAGPINIGVPAANLLGADEGTAFKLLAQHSNLVLRGIPGLTRLVPVSNKIEVIAQAGATDIVLEDIICDNSGNGKLQNQVKPASMTSICGGIAQLGNGANTFVRQYTGANLTVRRCSGRGMATLVHYIGDWTDISKLLGTLSVEDADFDDYCFGILAEQPRVIKATGLKSRNRANSINADASLDPGHDLYVTNRPGADPSLILVDGVLAEGSYNSGAGLYSDVSRASSIKVRKGQVVTITNVNVINNGKGVEVFNAQDVTVTSCSVKLSADDQDTNQAAYEFRDCGSLEYDSLIADVQGVDAWGLRVVTDQNSKPWHNRNLSGGRIKVITDHTSVGGGKAPIFVAGQIDAEIRYPRTEHHGSVANSRHPVDVRACTRTSIVFPSHKTPDAPSDAYKLVSLDSDCSACAVIYRDADLDTAVTGSTILDSGTGTKVTRIGTGTAALLNSDSSFTVAVAGAVSTPAFGWAALGDYAGWYRPASGQCGLSINGTLIVSYTDTRQILVGDTTPDAANTRSVGTSSLPFGNVYGATVHARDTVNSIEATLTANTLAFTRTSTNFIQATGSGAQIVINANNKVAIQYQSTETIKVDSNGATIGGSAGKVGFYGTAGAVKGAVSGSRGGNAALASLITYLASLNLLTDSSSA